MLVGVALAVLLAWVATSGEVHLWHESTELPATGGQGGTGTARQAIPDATVTSLPGVDAQPARWHLPAWVGSLLRLMLITLVGTTVVALWRRRPRWSTGAAPPPAWTRDPVAEVRAEIAADAEVQRAALQSGSPRNAITACWLRLEEIVGKTGVQRDPADTSTDFVRKVLTASTADADAINRLAELFREARFSSHAMGEGERSAAVAALHRVHLSLASDSRLLDDPVGAVSI